MTSDLREKVAKAIHTATWADNHDCYIAADSILALVEREREASLSVDMLLAEFGLYYIDGRRNSGILDGLLKKYTPLIIEAARRYPLPQKEE